MKKITSKEPFTFNVSGTESYDFTPEGVLVSDETATILKARLGSNVEVADIDVEEEVKKIVDTTEKVSTSKEEGSTEVEKPKKVKAPKEAE